MRSTEDEAPIREPLSMASPSEVETVPAAVKVTATADMGDPLIRRAAPNHPRPRRGAAP